MNKIITSLPLLAIILLVVTVTTTTTALGQSNNTSNGVDEGATIAPSTTSGNQSIDQITTVLPIGNVSPES